VISKLPFLLLNKLWIQEVKLLRDVRNHIYYIQRPLGNLIKLLNPASITKADMDAVIGEREAALVKLLTVTEARECELSELASTYKSIHLRNETISEDEV
jgi:hypothetical protein